MSCKEAFNAYDTLDGANCQTTFGVRMTQKEAAIEAVRKIGLNQKAEIRKEDFDLMPKMYDMFCKRLDLLKEVNGTKGQ